ncbi:restriction endonuclease subunit S [uncultured Marinobacter sp.]|uniref:restriction endonuclease subunit S n=1 Tax=uncultured Marinobacter sp. TaxID=187379 RepID=UPI00258E011A|nr:restriction endonuclease subunit S [uncultured Marinobacter sp.]
MRGDWAKRKLGDVISLQYGKPLPEENRCGEEGFPAYGANGIKCYAKRPYRDKPSIIVGRKGTAGAVNLVQGGFWPLDVTYYVTFEDKDYDLKFLYYLLSGLNLTSLATGVKPGINRNVVYAIEQSFPPLPEQKRIVAILDEAFAGIDAAIANTEKNLANARELFESFLSSVFIQQGGSWTEKPLEDFSDFISTGPFGSLLHKSDYVSDGVPLVNPINIVGDKIVPDEKKMIGNETKKRLQTYTLKAGDVAVARRGEIGRCAVISEKEDGWICGTGCFFIRPSEDTNPHFLAHLLRSASYRKSLERLSSGATMPNLSNKALAGLRISIPSVSDQSGIVGQIADLKEQCQSLVLIYQQKLTALSDLRQSLLHKAFSGELAADNIVEIAPEMKPKTLLATDSPEFAAYVMATAYHWHESQNRGKTFGRVKAQKILHLVESLADIDLGRQPIKDAAGPNDSSHMRAAESWARDHGFFEFVQRSTGQRGYDFKKGVRFGELVAEAMATLEPYKNVLNRVVKLLMPLNTTETEILATVYAAWNNLMLEGVESTDAAIIHEARENWHLEKQKYTKEQFLNAIHKLRNNGVVPMGRGKRVTGQESLAL